MEKYKYVKINTSNTQIIFVKILGVIVMEKEELVKAMASKLNINDSQAELTVNAVIAELASPLVFKKPGEEVGFINDNNCRNNCKEDMLRMPR
jgi:hypothetical protein